jgi:tetratricopeptide (TPR) repeat protein
VALKRAEYEEATARIMEALALYNECNGRLGKAHCIANLGAVALKRSKYEEATARFKDALLLYEKVSDRLGKADCICYLGNLLLTRQSTGGDSEGEDTSLMFSLLDV